MLDDGNFDEVTRIVARKAQIVERLSAGQNAPVSDSVETRTLLRDALDLISRITEVDEVNRTRLERWRSQSLLGLKQIHDHRHLNSAYLSK